MSKKKKKALSDFKRKRREFKKLMKFVLKNNDPSFERPEYKAGDILITTEYPIDTKSIAETIFIALKEVYGKRSDDYLRFFYTAIAYSLRDLDMRTILEIRVGEINTLVADLLVVEGGDPIYQFTIAANGNINVTNSYKIRQVYNEFYSYKVK